MRSQVHSIASGWSQLGDNVEHHSETLQRGLTDDGVPCGRVVRRVDRQAATAAQPVLHGLQSSEPIRTGRHRDRVELVSTGGHRFGMGSIQEFQAGGEIGIPDGGSGQPPHNRRGNSHRGGGPRPVGHWNEQ
jgi:hypothetical protein